LPLNRVTARRRLACGSLARGSRLPIVVALRASLSGGSRRSRQGLRALAPRQLQGAELHVVRSAPRDPAVEDQQARPALSYGTTSFRSGQACASLQYALASLRPGQSQRSDLAPARSERSPPFACPTRRLACQDCPHQRADSPTSSLGSPGTGLQGVGLRPHRQEGGCASLPVFFAALNRGCRTAQKARLS